MEEKYGNKDPSVRRKYTMFSSTLAELSIFPLTMVTDILNRNWGLQFWVLNLVCIRFFRGFFCLVCLFVRLLRWLVLWFWFWILNFFYQFRYRILFSIFTRTCYTYIRVSKSWNSNFVLMAVSGSFTVIGNQHCKIWHHGDVREKSVIFLSHVIE